MKTETTSQILFAAAKVAEVTGIDAYDLQKLHPSDFGVPGHWQMNSQGGVIYTERGVAALVDVLISRGAEGPASKLYAHLVEQQQAKAVPSRQLLAPVQKSTAPYYQTHPTLS